MPRNLLKQSLNVYYSYFFNINKGKNIKEKHHLDYFKKEEFFNFFSDVINQEIQSSLLEVLNPVVDHIQTNLRAKYH